MMAALVQDPEKIAKAKAFYKRHPVEFIQDWGVTFDPRGALVRGGVAKMPFILFPKQVELVRFLVALLGAQASGLVEKSRDMGATWVCASFSLWLWLFWPGSAVGWGSRKEQLVDRLGDPDSIFVKMRMQLDEIPRFFRPAGFDSAYMKLVNLENGSTITGEAGDNIGRGGRKLIYFKDESAHYERPDLIEASLMDNTRVQVDISSVNGIGNVFHRRREAGVLWQPGAALETARANVFVMDWRDHPGKSLAWYNDRRAKAEFDGLLHKFAQEVDRDYAASLQGTVIKTEWLRSCIDAHIVLKARNPELYGGMEDGPWGAGFDVADEGLDRNAFVKGKGVVLRTADEWGDRDTGASARRAVGLAEDTLPIVIQYDSIGVGAGVKAETNRLASEGHMPKGIRFVSWNAGAKVQDPERRVVPGDKDSPLNKDFFQNLKAQGWWSLARRCEKTHRAVTQGVDYPAEELISIDSRIPALRQIEKELAQPTMSKGSSMRMVVDKTPDGTRSPNYGDATMQFYFPVKEFVPPKAVFGQSGPTGR